jgi:ABC-type transport system involved in multi-copper enzyme maturation permease subunit
MFRVLFLKEVRDHFLSLRVAIGLSLGILLVAASAFVLSSIHLGRQLEMAENQRTQEELLARYAHTNRMSSFLRFTTRPPAPFVLVQGLDQENGAETLMSNPMPELFPVMDLAWSVAIIFSLFAIVIGFDAFNGEKERGTLRLLLANRVSRFQVAAAKWTAGSFILTVAMTAALLVGVLIVQLRANTAWNSDEWFSMLLLGFLSAAYCWVFFSVAFAASTIFSRSSVSVLASLFSWILLVLVIPNASPYIAAEVVPLSSQAAMERDLQYIQSEQRDQIGRARAEEVRKKYAPILTLEGLSESDIQARIRSDPEFKRIYAQRAEEIDQVWHDVNSEQQAKMDRLQADRDARARRQFELSRTLSLASPLPAYLYAATELSATGFETWQEFDRQIQRWRRSMDDYLASRYEAEKRADPTFGYNDFIDVSTRPRFQFRFPTFAERFAASAGYAGELCVWVVLLVGVAMARFRRFDVR